MRAVPPLPIAERVPGRAAPAPMPPPQPPSGPKFADLLQRGQATHGVLAQQTAPPPLRAGPQAGNSAHRDSDDAALAETRRAARSAPAQASAKPAQPREKAAPAAPPKPPAQAARPGADAQGEDTAVQRTATDTATGAAQGAGAGAWLAPLQLQEMAGADLGGHDTADGAGSTGGLGRGMTSTFATGQDTDTDTGAGDDSPGQSDAGIAMPGGARFAAHAAAFAAGAPAEQAAASSETAPARDATPSLMSGAAGAVPRGFDPGTLAPIAVPTALHAPDFAAALGAQVSLLARDGVQQAELHLNPAEMGPISVQIEIDGQQARIDFSADTAATREVIERGLPELAAALREQGLTLSGGGVFQRAPEQREQGPAMANAGRSKRFTATAAADVAASPAAMPVARGLLDLYA